MFLERCTKPKIELQQSVGPLRADAETTGLPVMTLVLTTGLPLILTVLEVAVAHAGTRSARVKLPKLLFVDGDSD